MAINENIIRQIALIEKEAFSDYWTENSIADTLTYDYNRVFLEFDENGIVGYIIANILADETELLRIAVKKEKQNQGIAGRLLQVYFEAMPECKRFLLEVRAENASARHLYEKFGYREIATRKNYYKNPVDNAIIYEKTV